jgi:hypothetical protein
MDSVGSSDGRYTAEQYSLPSAIARAFGRKRH